MRIYTILIFLSVLLAINVNAASVQELEKKVDILAEEIEKLKISNKNPKANRFFGLGQSASRVYSITDGVSIGGYGEMVLNIPSDKDESDNPSSSVSEAEALRGVFYFGNKFSEKWILNTEVEIEHADEIFLEFAYLDYLHQEQFNVRTGLILLPMGLINELHEPIYFNSVNRPQVENKIIPSTWRELGAGIYGRIKGLTYKLFIVNGLNADGLTADGIRGGRKKGGVVENASTIATVLRLDYQFSPQLLFGTALYTGTASGPTNGNVGVSLYQGHFDFNYQGAFLRGLYVGGSLDDTERFNTNSGETVAEKMAGYYFDLGYNFEISDTVLSPFMRYEVVDTQKDLVSGLSKDQSKDRTNITLGLSFRPIDKIIYKLDYVMRENEAKTGLDEINLGIGYLF